MEVSIFLAKMFAIYFVVMGVGMFVNKKYALKAMKACKKNSTIMFYGSAMALLAGSAMVLVHNNWVKDWTLIITIIAWLGLLKGVLLSLFPSGMLKFAEKMYANKAVFTVMMLVIVVVGLVLGYFGFTS